METFTEPKNIVVNPKFREQRQKCLAGLTDKMIDLPILDIVTSLNSMPYCFTLQCCYGHFLHKNQKDPNNLESLPTTNTIDRIEYKIAYLAFCIENSEIGRKLLEDLSCMTLFDPQNVHFGSAEWFWERQLNSYALQVEPDRFKYRDNAILGYREALKIESTRNKFFSQLRKILE